MTRTLIRLGAAAALFSGAVLAAAPVKEDGPLPVQSVWKGKVTQKGEIEGMEVPLDLHAEFTITKRDGDKFEAELYEYNDGGIKLTYLVKGEVTKGKDGKTLKVDFKSYDFKDAESRTFLNIPYSGTLDGKKLKGTWKHPKNDEGTTIEGEFTLELSK